MDDKIIIKCNISDVKDGDTLTVGQACTISFIKNEIKNNVEKQFEDWMQGFYPYAKYTNSLSKKWILKFAEFYAKQQ